eukprot:357510-Chlamydomonas_euryale.AAC.8
MRGATPPHSGAQLPSALHTALPNSLPLKSACPRALPGCCAARRAGAPSSVGSVSRGHKSKCHGALCVDQHSRRQNAASVARVSCLCVRVLRKSVFQVVARLAS